MSNKVFTLSILKPTLKTIGFNICFIFSSIAISHAAITPPEMDNTAYVLMDFDTGEILAQKNADEPMPPASLTKMMTSFIIEEQLESGQMKETDPIVMSKNAWCGGNSGQSCMFVPVNETASAIDMLRGIIIQSGNDASVAMAEHIAGSQEAFSELMNQKAAELGMKNSHFVNATGMPAEGHEASAMDLAILARAIINHGGKYYSIYAEKEFTYNGIKQANRNTLLQTDPTVDGLKTGHTNAAGYCLVSSSNRDNMRLISVILGTKSKQERADQSRNLLNWGFGHFVTNVLAPKGQFVQNSDVWYGSSEQVELATADDLQVLTTKIQQNDVTTSIDIKPNLEAPIHQGDVLGTMYAVVEGKAVASVDLVATHDVQQSGFFKKLWQKTSRWFSNLF